MTETMELAVVGAERLRPAQSPCPGCSCCTAELCARGRVTVMRCVALTGPETRALVAGCPCSAETTRGTMAWRVGRVRATTHATQVPLPPRVEGLLRAVAAGGRVTSPELLPHLTMWRYIRFTGSRPVITEMGLTYLAGRDRHRYVTPVEVEAVDVLERTARVTVLGWRRYEAVTVPLEQLTLATGLMPEELPGVLLRAEAPRRAASSDDVVLTRVELVPLHPVGPPAPSPAPSPGAESGRLLPVLVGADAS